jgi:hypothetical protein
MTEISSLKSLGKVFFLTNRIPICDVFCAKKAFMRCIVFLLLTVDNTLCMRREQRIILSMFHWYLNLIPRFPSTIEFDIVVMATWQYI